MWASPLSGRDTVSLMWVDADGVTHTVALPDPSSAMSATTIAALNALSGDERVRVLGVLDDYYWNDYIANSRSEIIASHLAPEGAPLPDGFLAGPIRSAEEALALVKSTEPAWRIDVLEAIQDYLEDE
jgi:hypothetical protein